MNFATLDLNLLRVFDEVMSEGNLTRAASNLSITQPAVSNALARLRFALGDELVVRSGYGVTPTAKARALWPGVQQALMQIRNTLVPDDFDAASASNSFVVSMADATAAMLIPHLIRTIETEAPGISLRVMPLTTRDPRALLERNEIDMAIGYFPRTVAAITLEDTQAGTTGRIGHERLYQGEYVCVMRHEHPQADQKLTLDAFCTAHHLLVNFSGRAFDSIDETLTSLKRSRRIVATVNQFFTAGQVVCNSDLLTVLPAHFLASTGMLERLTAHPLPFEVRPVSVEMLWHRHREVQRAHQWLQQAVRQAAAKAFEKPTLRLL